MLAPYQGINVLMEAAQQLLPTMPDVHFLIMGYPGVDRYRRLASSLGIADHVTLPGRILYSDLHAYLALGDVAVAPKMSETEGSGKIPNYMAMGLPIVTFDTPVSREYLGDIGIYARFGSAERPGGEAAAGARAARLGRAAGPAWPRARAARAFVGPRRAGDRGDLRRRAGALPQAAGISRARRA